METGNHSSWFASTVSEAHTHTPKQLRKMAKAMERERRRDRKAQKRAAKECAQRRKRLREDRTAARAALHAVANDKTKGYARVQAARTLLGLDES